MVTRLSTSACQRDRDRIRCALQYVEDHLEDPLTLASVAQQCHISRFHFHRLFHEAVGETLSQYIRRLRIERSAFHLIYSSDTVEHLAAAAGYESTPAFVRAFKASFKMAPSLYRKVNCTGFCPKDERHDDRPSAYLELFSPPVYRLFPARRVAYVRRLGVYKHAARAAWAALNAHKGLEPFIADRRACIGIRHDHPLITAESQCRFDACVVVPDEVVPSGDVGIRLLKAGRYAAFQQRDFADDDERIYHAEYYQWLLSRAENPIDAAVLVQYGGHRRLFTPEINIALTSTTRTSRQSPADCCYI